MLWGSWSLGAKIRAIGHCIFLTSKLPLLSACVDATISDRRPDLQASLQCAVCCVVFVQCTSLSPVTLSPCHTVALPLVPCTQYPVPCPMSPVPCPLSHVPCPLIALSLLTGCLQYFHRGKALLSKSRNATHPSVSQCLFIQAFQQLNGLDPALLRAKPDEQKEFLFPVKFKTFSATGGDEDEQGLDWGGLYREAANTFVEDVFDADTLTLCIPSPNLTNHVNSSVGLQRCSLCMRMLVGHFLLSSLLAVRFNDMGPCSVSLLCCVLRDGFTTRITVLLFTTVCLPLRFRTRTSLTPR